MRSISTANDRSIATLGATGAAIRAVAAIEGLKGVVVLLAASGLLAFVHEDLNAFAARLVEHAT